MSRPRKTLLVLRVAALALAALGACSNPAAGGPGSSVAKGAALASAAARRARGADAATSQENAQPALPVPAVSHGEHVIALPPEPARDYPSPAVALAPGESPSPAFPEGTVYVARSEQGVAVVTEWDLAARQPRRRVELALPAGCSNLRLLHAGGAMHLLAWIFNDEASYLRLTEDLRVVATTRLGTVSPTGPMGLASDGAFTVVVAEGSLSEEKGPLPVAEGVFAASFDEAGRLVARRMLARNAGGHPSGVFLTDAAVVAAGKAFVLLRTPSRSGLEVLRLDRRLSVERRAPLRAPEVYVDGTRTSASDTHDPALFARGGRLFIDAPEAETTLELSFQGTETRRAHITPEDATCSAARRSADHDVWVGPEHVMLSYGPETGQPIPASLHWTLGSREPDRVPRCTAAR